MPNPISVYVKFGSDGKLLERKVTREVLGSPWVALTRAANEATMARPIAFRYSEDGSAEPLPKCKMVISTTSFLANGIEDFSVSIRGDAVPDGDEVSVTINGEEHMIPKDDQIEVTASSPGAFVVKMTDPRYYCDDSEVVVYAVS